MKIKSASYWIDKLNLQSHPEGGWFCEIYRSSELVSGLPKQFSGPRSVSTSIYYMLEKDDVSHFHRIKSDEIWHFYTGDSSIRLYSIHPSGRLSEHLLGPDPEKGEKFQVVIPGGCWFAAELTNKSGYTLIGCTVSPGFDFNDFEMAEQVVLCSQFPEYSETISKLTLKKKA